MALLIFALVFTMLAVVLFAIKAAQSTWDLLHIGLAVFATGMALVIADALHTRGAF